VIGMIGTGSGDGVARWRETQRGCATGARPRIQNVWLIRCVGARGSIAAGYMTADPPCGGGPWSLVSGCQPPQYRLRRSCITPPSPSSPAPHSPAPAMPIHAVPKPRYAMPALPIRAEPSRSQPCLACLVLPIPAAPCLAYPSPACLANNRRALTSRALPFLPCQAGPRRAWTRRDGPCHAVPALTFNARPCLSRPGHALPLA